MSDGVGGGGVPWFKILMFAMIAIMLAGIASVILDPGLGRPEESRRTRHPAGFSIGLPAGWGGTVYFANAKEDDAIRIAPERVTGRQTSIRVVKHRQPQIRDDLRIVDGTFQGKPAWTLARQGKYDWTYRITFERGGAWYSIIVGTPLELDMRRDPLLPFMESFRTDPILHAVAPATTTTSAPVTVQP